MVDANKLQTNQKKKRPFFGHIYNYMISNLSPRNPHSFSGSPGCDWDWHFDHRSLGITATSCHCPAQKTQNGGGPPWWPWWPWKNTADLSNYGGFNPKNMRKSDWIIIPTKMGKIKFHGSKPPTSYLSSVYSCDSLSPCDSWLFQVIEYLYYCLSIFL